MSKRLGMSLEDVRSAARQLEANVAALDGVKFGVQMAAAASLSTAIPGSIIFAPWTLKYASQAVTDILLAQNSARELILKLESEALAQEFASSSFSNSYYSGWAPRTSDASRGRKLSKSDLAKNPLALLTDREVVNSADLLFSLYGVGEGALAAIELWGKDTWNAITDWNKSLPSWAKSIKRVGKAVPYVGSIVTVIDMVEAWEKGDTAGIINYTGSLIIDIVGLIPPAAPIAAIVGVAWDVGWGIGENVTKMVQDPGVIPRAMNNPWIAIPMMVAPVLTLAFAEFE